MLIRPKNWGDFQHYKDRGPSWIKLHKRLLDDFEFQSLPVASRALAPMLWLLASENKTGLIDAEDRKLAFRLRMTPAELEDAIGPLISAEFFEVVRPDITPLATPDYSASPENKEERREQEQEKVLPVGTGLSVPKPGLEPKRDYPADFDVFWKAYPTDANMPKKPAFKAWRRLTPGQRADALAAIPGFRSYIAANSWYRPIYAERFLSQEKFEGYAAGPKLSIEEIAAANDKADRLMKRGIYAPEQMR